MVCDGIFFHHCRLSKVVLGAFHRVLRYYISPRLFIFSPIQRWIVEFDYLWVGAEYYKLLLNCEEVKPVNNDE